MHPAAKRDVQAAAERIRPATLTDLPRLLDLEARFPGDRLSPRQFRHHLRSPRAVLRLAEAGSVVGYSMLLRHGQRPAWRLYSIVVDPDCRGRGWGARLLDDALEQARRAGAPGLTLEVRADNAAALALYRARGFEEIGLRAGYYDDGVAAVCLRRVLLPGS
ncbi:GNAT family N-acetyltransferase [Pseudomarimonas salicorniae]|uniref:GNAT family N-acetyltransferase n=1 Tax=Pseudomarimonas salicorniae TaxID=2933270 RepID=A0ABT0GE43_9GAMM|nr:GNAT family N-acetyltransferase [Lysobacter sp. CAU 1642]